MATTYATFIDGTYGKPQRKLYLDGKKREYILRKTVDFSQQTLTASASDVLQCLSIPASVWVKKVWMNVLTAETANGTVDVGDATAANFFGNGMFIDATGYVAPVLSGSATWNAGSLDVGEREAKEITVDGAALGDQCHVTLGVDVTDLAVTGTVTAADTVTVVLANTSDTLVATGGSTWNPASLNDGQETVQEFTVTGAALGDYVDATSSIDVADLILTAQVTATNTVTAQFVNSTGGAIDLGSTTIGLRVRRAGSALDLASTTAYATVFKSVGDIAGGKFYSSADTIDLTVTSDGAAVDLDGAKVEIYAHCMDLKKID